MSGLLNHELVTVLDNYALVVVANLLASEVVAGSCNFVSRLHVADASAARELKATEAYLRAVLEEPVAAAGSDVEGNPSQKG